MVSKFGHFGKKIKNSLKVLICGAVLEMAKNSSWTERVKNVQVLRRVKEECNILRTMKRTKANWIGHILRRNCLLEHAIVGKVKGKTEVT
jgi:hypothetical protein